jgi:hypothetical protein
VIAIPKREWLPFLGAFALVLLVYQVELGNPLLWGDEADTGNFGRSVLEHGLPRAVVHENVLAYGDCYQLGAGLLSRQVPWVQYYVAAASLWLFGDDTVGVRRLFALLGALAAWPLWLVLRRRTGAAATVVAVMLLLPQAALFARQARYYPLLTLLFATWLWLYCSRVRSRAARTAIASALAVLLFHSHALAGLAASVALSCHAALFEAQRRRETWIASAAGFASWLVFYLGLQPMPSATASPLAVLWVDPGAWAIRTASGIGAGFFDLDFVGSLPSVGVAGVVAAALSSKARRTASLNVLRGPAGAIVIALLAAIAINAAAVGVETSQRHSLLRYLPHLCALALLPVWLLLESLLPTRWAMAALVALYCTQLPALSYWYAPSGRGAPLSWWPAVYGELLAPPPDDLIALTRELGRVAAGERKRLVVVPGYATDVFVFLVGDRFFIRPDIRHDSACAHRLEAELGAQRWRAIYGRPDFALVFGPSPQPSRAGFFAYRRGRPDGARPELTRHAFARDSGQVSGFSLLTAGGRR